MIEAAIFDLDGTLVDTPRAIVTTFTATFADLGLPDVDAGTIRATIGLPLERAFGELVGVPADGGLVARCVGTYQALFRTQVLPGAAALVYPGVAAGLDLLGRDGVALAVATSKHYASADALLAAAGLREHFAVVIGADQVARPKPDPEMGRLVLRRLAVPADRAVMVGDTTHDLAMAAAAGLRSIAVTYGVHSEARLRVGAPTWLADSFDEVLTYVRTPSRQRGGDRIAHRRAGPAG